MAGRLLAIRSGALRQLLPLGIGASALASCFYVPPLPSVPADIDTPPFVLGLKSNIVADLSDGGEVRFAVDAVYDRNESELIEYAFSLRLDPDDPISSITGSGVLRLRDAQAFDDVTVYDGVEQSLGACDILLRAKGDGEFVTVELTLVDPLPPDQRIEGFEEFEVVYSWRVRFTGECP